MAGMAEWQKEWSNGGNGVNGVNGVNGGNGGTAERMAEWQNGRMATYVLFMVHTDDDNDNDDDDDNDDTLIFYITESHCFGEGRSF
jgi:hypothetical protein